MGTISHLPGRRARDHDRCAPCAIVVTVHGFAAGDQAVAWQAVSTIRAGRGDLPDGNEALLELTSGDRRVVVGERQPGFAALEAALVAAFPGCAGWRGALPGPPAAAGTFVVLYRRD